MDFRRVNTKVSLMFGFCYFRLKIRMGLKHRSFSSKLLVSKKRKTKQ